MAKSYKIAIIGAGTAGAASALYLSKQGHTPVVFEKEKEPRPFGAGIMIQPTGLKCMDELGLGDQVRERGTPLYGMIGNNEAGKSVVKLAFNNNEGLHGVGVHRSSLYLLLYNKLKTEGIELCTGVSIVDIQNESNAETKEVVDSDGKVYAGFDFVIVASGARSLLRQGKSILVKESIQKYGALWAKIEHDNSILDNTIRQVYKGSYKMAGLMPIGKIDKDSSEYINFFWSIRMSDLEKWRNTPLEEWKKEVIELCPEYKEVVDKITDKSQVMEAPYMDVKLKRSYEDKVLFLGDSAHPMSPQLSHGVSFALLDAKFFAESLASSSSIEQAFKHFQKSRYKQVRYYQQLSNWITPMFQSDAKNTWFRDTIFKFACALKISRSLLQSTILGYREGYFTNLDSKYYQS